MSFQLSISLASVEYNCISNFSLPTYYDSNLIICLKDAEDVMYKAEWSGDDLMSVYTIQRQKNEIDRTKCITSAL